MVVLVLLVFDILIFLTYNNDDVAVFTAGPDFILFGLFLLGILRPDTVEVSCGLTVQDYRPPMGNRTIKFQTTFSESNRTSKLINVSCFGYFRTDSAVLLQLRALRVSSLSRVTQSALIGFEVYLSRSYRRFAVLKRDQIFTF